MSGWAGVQLVTSTKGRLWSMLGLFVVDLEGMRQKRKIQDVQETQEHLYFLSHGNTQIMKLRSKRSYIFQA